MKTKNKDGWLIDPINITNFEADDFELELMILFWVAAAGKNGVTAAHCLRNMLTYFAAFMMTKVKDHQKFTPFSVIRHAINEGVDLSAKMKEYGIGCYGSKSKTFKQLVESNLNLRTCTVEDLEKIHGIGSKTSRCYLIHSRKNVKHAGLDVHVLRFLKDQGYDVPQVTPSKKKYLEIEKIFIDLATKAKKSIAEYDLEIWRQYSGRTV